MLLWFLLVEHLIYIRLQNWAKTNSEMFVLFLKFLRSWVVAKQSKSFGQMKSVAKISYDWKVVGLNPAKIVE